MTMREGDDQPRCVQPDARRTTPANQADGSRATLLSDHLNQRRPFTTIGAPLFDLDAATRGNDPAPSLLQPLRRPASQQGIASVTSACTAQQPGEFDVRKFLLDQKGGQPLHKSALFRVPTAEVSSRRKGAGRAGDDDHGHGEQQQLHASASSRKKVLPRVEHGSKKPLPGGALVQPPAAAADDTVSHFYTIEKLAESCFHAVQSKRHKTWQFLPGAEERSKSSSGFSANASSGGANSLTNVERPSRRVDILDLDKCFDLAMHFVKQDTRQWDASSSGSCHQQLSTLDRDVMTIQAAVARRYELATKTKKKTPVSTGDGGPGEKEAGGAGPGQAEPDSDTTTTEEAVQAAAKNELTEDQRVLARTLFEQKWSDMVLGEVEAMLTSSFLEQGALLHKTRVQYAQCFFKLETLYNARTKELALTLETLANTQQQLLQASDHHTKDTQQLKSQYEEELQQLSLGFETRREEMERKATESKDQMTKMGDTMKTLNTIFRQMREDTEKVKAVELRENFCKLEKKYESCKEEVERLRPLVQLTQKLHDQKELVVIENEKLRAKIESYDPLLASKDEVIAGLMEQQSELLAAQELRAAQDDELRRMEEANAAEDEEDDDDEYNDGGEGRPKRGGEGDATSQLQQRGAGGRRGSGAVVCVRCKENLRFQSQGGGVGGGVPGQLVVGASAPGEGAENENDQLAKDPTAMHIRKKRIQCMYFRILLPNLRGRRPQRELSWTLSCMRSIVFAKQLDDAMCASSGGAFPLRIRMPEFVYAWFSPWKPLREEKATSQYSDDDGDGDLTDHGDAGTDSHHPNSKTKANAERTEEQRQLQADEDRWCLYYGVKALVQEGYLEAKLFLSLLDEKYGEDEQVFMLHCYRVVDVLLGGKLNYGPLRDHVSYEKFHIQYETLFGPRLSSASDLYKAIYSKPRVPKTIWISPYHASLATSMVLGKATETERSALDKKLLEFAVTNLSEEERPAVYLTPAKSTALRRTGSMDTVVDNQQPAHHDTDHHDKDKNGKPLQFVDANLWVELMMMEYKEEQAHRRAAIRLMFQTATAVSSSSSSVSLSAPRAGSLTTSVSSSMDMEQFRIMIRTLNDELPTFMVATLFRAAFVRGNGNVNFESFLDAAEYAQFFSSCMRLENPAISMGKLPLDSRDIHAPSSAALSTSVRAAFVADKFFTLMHKQMEDATQELPLWTRSLADTLVYNLSTMLLHDSGSGGTVNSSDGVLLLTSFHRLLDVLLMANLTKKDATGCVLSSKSIFCFEKALQALLDCVRVGEKSGVEQLMDTVKQKLCVKRVQTLFRKHLARDGGAPLVMRPLFHKSYGVHQAKYRLRRSAERPYKWLMFVISDVLRRSLKSERIHWLLLELSSVSSVLRPSCRAIASSSSSSTAVGTGGGTAKVNGGIGVAPKPLLVELIYDSFIDKFGTRMEAEKLIHDVFANCRAFLSCDPLATSDKTNKTGKIHAHAHDLAVLFSHLCCLHDGSSTASSDDRLMAQNEALAFLHAVFRCGLHQFHVINPPPPAPQAAPPQGSEDSHDDGLSTSSKTSTSTNNSGMDDYEPDLVSLKAAKEILTAAFAKQGADQKQRIKARLDEQATIWKTPGVAASAIPPAKLRGSIGLPKESDLVPQQYLPADTFLVTALHEWKLYIQHRMHELRVICCSMEDEIAYCGDSLPLDVLATVLQKANVTFSNEELCVIFRRLCLTEQHGGSSSSSSATTTAVGSTTTGTATASIAKQSTRGSTHTLPIDHMSDRVAAACYPLLARETLLELRKLENAAPNPFKLLPAAEASAKFLVETWRAYDEPCRVLLDELRRLGKNNDIQAEAISRRAPINGGRAFQREVLYLSSSTSSDTLSSQDVAQLEALYALFHERMDKMNKELSKNTVESNRQAVIQNARRMSVSMSMNGKNGGLLALDDDAKEALLNTKALAVNETWKVFRQLLVSFSRLRALAKLGNGPLPDKWDAVPTQMA